MRPSAAALLLIAVSATPASAQHDHPGSPYEGMEARAIKALSAEEVAQLLAGEGMGLALAAELNGHPGPKHVLEHADALSLTADQRARVEEIWTHMAREAVELGRAIVAGEEALDALFASGRPDVGRVRQATLELGRLRGELRAVHLAAHLETDAVLSDHQRHRYSELRGYAGVRP